MDHLFELAVDGPSERGGGVSGKRVPLDEFLRESLPVFARDIHAIDASFVAEQYAADDEDGTDGGEELFEPEALLLTVDRRSLEAVLHCLSGGEKSVDWYENGHGGSLNRIDITETLKRLTLSPFLEKMTAETEENGRVLKLTFGEEKVRLPHRRKPIAPVLRLKAAPSKEGKVTILAMERRKST